MNAIPRVGPPEDGLRLALATARHRRLRTAGTTTSITAAALSVAVLALSAPGSQTLLQQPAPERPAVSTVVQDDDPAPSPAPRANSAAVGATAVSAGPSTVPSPTARITQGAGPAAPADRSPRRYAAGALTKQSEYFTVPNCAVEDAASLCRSASTYASATGVLQLYADLCSTQTDTATLHYPGRNELDLEVLNSRGEVVWHWSTWHPDGGVAHTMTVSTGTCTSWTFDWTMVDSEGKPLPKGDYRLRARYLADEFAETRAVTTTFTLS